MDDLMAKLQEVLGTKEGQENLRQIAGMLGGQDGSPDLSALSGLLGQNAPPSGPSQQAETQTPEAPALDYGALLKIQQLLQSTGREDKNTALIRALRPHLKETRQHRADEALRLLRLLSLLPLLRESGLLGNLFGGDR